MIPERQAMMAGLPVAAVTAALYLLLMAVHLLSPGPIVHALVLAVVMSAGARAFSLMFSTARADTSHVNGNSLATIGGGAPAVGYAEPLSAVEEERLISQLETELDVLERRYRQELTAMQDATRKNAGPPDEQGRL